MKKIYAFVLILIIIGFVVLLTNQRTNTAASINPNEANPKNSIITKNTTPVHHGKNKPTADNSENKESDIDKHTTKLSRIARKLNGQAVICDISSEVSSDSTIEIIYENTEINFTFGALIDVFLLFYAPIGENTATVSIDTFGKFHIEWPSGAVGEANWCSNYTYETFENFTINFDEYNKNYEEISISGCGAHSLYYDGNDIYFYYTIPCNLSFLRKSDSGFAFSVEDSDHEAILSG